MMHTTRCASSQAAATLAAAEKLVQDVRTYRGANPSVTLAVSGAGSDAVAKRLQRELGDAGITNVAPGASEGTLVVARQNGAEVAQFRSVTIIVPVR